MRAAVLHTYGDPDVLNIEQRPEPALRDTDILVEVHATSVNPVDTKVRKTGGGGGRTLPLKQRGKHCICGLGFSRVRRC